MATNNTNLNRVERAVLNLNQRLGFNDHQAALSYNNAPCYGGYRLEVKGGSTGFAYNNGTERRMSRKEFLIYLQGLHDMPDHFKLNGGAA